ncbi:MFS transporter [Alphaproteobacteria bacterium LSUCC0396]
MSSWLLARRLTAILDIISMQATSNTGNVIRLAAAQALSMTTMNVNIINTALVGSLLSPVPWLATLGLSLQFVTSMLTTLPASLLMVRFGRRPVFMGGVMIAAISAFTQGIAILISNFYLFCAASMALGIAHGCAGFYRYAAADSAEESQKPKAISYVLTGGLLAAFMGPEIARNTVDFVPGHLYAGCFFSVAAVQLVSLGFLSGVKIPKPTLTGSGGRPIGTFFTMPVFVVGAISAAIGYAMMSYMMTATPLQVVNVAKLGTSANATIIQWHVVAMFAPAFFTGNLISRFGAPVILTAGVLTYLAAIASAVLGIGFWWYFVSLALMGLGWNFLYIGGSSLVASVANPEERGRVQGIADLITTTSVATASLVAGALHSQFGWEVMVLSALGPVLIITLSLSWLILSRRSMRV